MLAEASNLMQISPRGTPLKLAQFGELNPRYYAESSFMIGIVYAGSMFLADEFAALVSFAKHIRDLRLRDRQMFR